MPLPIVGLSLGAFLVSIVVPLAKKVLLGLGIGWLTYTGLSAIGAQVTNEINALWGQVGGPTLQLASLLGIPQSIGIILGGMAGRISLAAVERLGKVVA